MSVTIEVVCYNTAIHLKTLNHRKKKHLICLKPLQRFADLLMWRLQMFCRAKTIKLFKIINLKIYYYVRRTSNTASN